MDTQNFIRARAAALHDELVRLGTDPFNPMELVQAAVRHCELLLSWLPRGDAALKGARALFDEQAGVICCEREADPPTRALLVAHELGHVALHTGPTACAARDIDPSRSTEEAPVGMQGVEDYGAHERREMEANLYARELLFPRPFAREQHSENGLTAADIVEQTQLPPALVWQQLFDALLLRAMPVDSEPARQQAPPGKPDPSQERAAAHRGTPFQLQAGPGTGKTRTLVKRVLSLLADRTPAASILVLTFSNRAAGELAERLTASAPEAVPKLWIGTFHAFGLDLIRRHHDRLGLPPAPALFDRSDAIEVLEEILPILPLKHYRNLWDPALVLRDIVAAISRAKDEMVDPERYRLLAQAMYSRSGSEEERIDAEKCLEIAAIYDLYEEALRKRGGVDFGDLIMRPTRLLEEDAAARITVQCRHRNVLVDEYQDVNRASARLLKAVSGDGAQLWVVGDARQSIYRFRGASSQNMPRFKDDYCGAVVDQLRVNYRSTAQIVRTFVCFASQMGASEGMLPLRLESSRGEGPSPPEIRSFDLPEDEAAGVAASVRELERSGVRLRDQAVLCRTNWRLNEIAAALEARGIPVLHLGSLFEREEVRDLLALLSLAVDPQADGLVRVGLMPRYGLTLQDVHCLTRYIQSLRKPALTGLAEGAGAPGLSAAGRTALQRLAADLTGLNPGASAWEFLAMFLLDRTDLAKRLGQGSSVTEQVRAVAVWQLLNFLREPHPAGAGSPIQRTLHRVRQLVLLAEERDLRQVPAEALHLEAVRMMTVHGSKGLEFEAVHVPGLTVHSFPAVRQGERCAPPDGMIEGATGADEGKRAHDTEEECLFFVALSRARTHLRIYHAQKQPSGKTRTASPFLHWLPAEVHRNTRPSSLPLARGAPRPRPVEITWPSGWSLTDRHLVSYDRCARRFFYTDVLGLGRTGRRATAFTRTHGCLYELLRWLTQRRRTAEPTVREAEAAFDVIWAAHGPVSHAFAADYRRLASTLIEALIRAGIGHRFREARPLAVDFPHGRVVVEPNELAEVSGGTLVIRRVQTGRRRHDEYDRLDYTLYRLAADLHFRGRAAVHALHLTDGTVEPVVISPTKLGNRRKKSDTLLARISAGFFPASVDAVACPRCPHFFICPATPSGPLHLSEVPRRARNRP